MSGSVESIPLDEEIEGEYETSADLLFFRIGAAVPLKPSDSRYDLKDPPKQPLAVSQRFGMLFVGHSEGFFVAKTKNVIDLAKEIKETIEKEKKEGVTEGHKRHTIQEASIVDVRIGKVSILSLSTDSLTLAATVGGEIHLFSVPLLAKKKEDPFLLCSPSKSGPVKDLQWCKNLGKSFIVLLTCGSLFHGNMDGHLKEIMDNVDAVGWNMEGSLLAASINGTLRILSQKFEIRAAMNLLLESKGADKYSGCRMKVDSIKWTTSNTIIVGCIQQDEDGRGSDYSVQVIICVGSGFEASSRPFVITFSEPFRGMCDQVSGGGPHLFTSYLERWRLAVLANRANMDDHVILLEFLIDDDIKKAALIELEQEKYMPRIELQENGDDNFILGLDVDKISLYEKLSVIKGEEVVEISPYCILLCLTSEGKIVLFHVARSSDPPSPLPVSCEVLDDFNIPEDNSSMTLFPPNEPPIVVPYLKNDKLTSEPPMVPILKDDKLASSTAKLEQKDQIPSALLLKKIDDSLASSTDVPSMAGRSNTIESLEIHVDRARGAPFSGFSSAQSSVLEPVAVLPNKQGFAQPQPLGNFSKPSVQAVSAGTYTSKVSDTSSPKPNLISSSIGMNLQSTGDFFRSTDASTKGCNSSISQGGYLGSRLSGKHIVSEAGSANFSPLAFSSSLSSSVDAKDRGGFQAQFSSTRSFVINHAAGTKFTTPVVKGDHAQGKLISVPAQSEGHPSYRAPQTLGSSELSGHVYNVMSMVKELDRLQLEIEGKGGFADMCTLYLRNSVLALEKGLEGLSEKSRICKGSIAELVAKVQHLQDKMVQVSAREGYMQGVIKQASNSQYWDIWSRQKLGPEFELKQQQISKINQDVRNQLIELERHFNILELNRFGESSEALKGLRATSTSESSRRIRTVHRLYNTVVSQLSVAERLSDSLAEQMAVLKIASPSAKKQNMTREVLESIGVTCQESFESPDTKGTSLSSCSSTKYPSPMLKVKDAVTKSKPNKLKGIEPESGRRRRDSLDKSLTSFEPQKTTVKRVLQEERSKISSAAREEIVSTKAVEDLVFQKKAGEHSRAASIQPVPSKSELSIIQASKEYQEDFPERGSTAQSDFTPKWREDFPGFSQSAAEFRNWRAPETHVSQTSNILFSSSASVLSGIEGRMEHTNTSGILSSKPAYTGLQNFSPTTSASVIKVSSNVDYRSVTNLQSFLNFASPAKSPLSEAGLKSEAGLMVSGSDGRNGVSSSTVPVKLNQDAQIFGSSLSPATIGKGSIAKANLLANTSVPLDASGSVASECSITSVSAGAGSATSSLGSLSSVMPAQTNLEKLPNSSLHDTYTKQPSSVAMPSASSIFSSPIFLPSQVSQPSPPSPPNTIPQGSVSWPYKIGGQASAPLSAVTLPGRKSDSLGFSTQLFSSGSSSSTIALTSSSTTISSSIAVASSAASVLSGITVKEKDTNFDLADTQEDEMEEEAPDTSSLLNLGGFGGFGLGSTHTPGAPKTNPFGGSFAPASPSSSTFSASTSPGQLFKPASFTIPSLQQAPSSLPNSSAVSGGFGGFGQPAQVGVGQQALGSVLGAFGQTRQLGSGQGFGFGSGGFGGGVSPATSAASGFSPTSGFAGAPTGGFTAIASGGGGFAGSATTGGFGMVGTGGMGFAGAGTGSGFSGLGSSGGGFAGAATGGGGFSGGGGFAGAATGGGFGALGSSSGGFAGVASGGGFGGAVPAGGGFGGPSSGGFGSASGAGKPPVELLMKMRK